MKELPILMSAPMVRALLAGTKSQTRREMKPQPFGDRTDEQARARLMELGALGPDESLEALVNGARNAGFIDHPCPYGAPGDRLWVKETHMDLGACVLYRADASAERERAIAAPGQRWMSSIHMPRRASRITLEVTDVRVERIQSISEADALAEGIGRYDNGTFGLDDPGACMGPSAKVAYMRLWESINGAGTWDHNRWVWVVSFKRVPG